MPMYLKKRDGQEFGPIEMDVVKQWAAQGRVEPSDVLSEDRDSWKPAPEYNELGMEWVIDLPDGQEYGPVNALALANLLKEEMLRPESEIRRQHEGERAVTSDVLREAMQEQERQNEQTEPSAEAGARSEKMSDTEKEPIPSTGEHIKADAALVKEAARWREMYESARKDSRRREDVLIARLDEISEVKTSPASEDELSKSEFDAQLAELAPAELRQRYYASQKEGRKWRVMYEQARLESRERDDRLNQRIEEFQKSEAEMRRKLSTTTRRLTSVESNFAELIKATESKNGDRDVALASQLGGMLQAYTDLSQSYDMLFSQLDQRNEELAAAMTTRKEFERVAEERFAELEEMVYKEQQAADHGREQLTTLQTTYHQLVRSYREMNDRYIAWRHRYGQGS